MDLQKIKFETQAAKSQYAILDKNGYLLSSCDSIFETQGIADSLFELDDLLSSSKDEIYQLKLGEHLTFPCINWNYFSQQKIVDYSIKLIEADERKYLWIIEDYTAQYERVKEYQQLKNDQGIDLSHQKKENEKLLEAQAFKVRFLQDLSHEINNPLWNIIGLVDLVKEESDELKKASYLNSLMATSKRLNAITHNLMDISAFESGNLKVDMDRFSVRDLVMELVDSYEGTKFSKKIDFLATVSDDVSETIESDPIRLMQVLFSLFGYCAKNGGKGSIELHVSKVTLPAGNFTKFSITANGMSMSFADIKAIFEHKGDNKNVGIGLGISRSLIRLLGGELSLKSEKEEGTEFSFQLPIKDEEKIEVKKTIDENAMPKHGEILIADDDDMSLLLLRSVLTKFGFVADYAKDGKETIDKFEQKDYDLIIVDYEMPEMNGVEVAAQVKKKKEDLPVVLISGLDINVDSDPNIYARLPKPLNKEVFKRLLVDILGQKE